MEKTNESYNKNDYENINNDIEIKTNKLKKRSSDSSFIESPKLNCHYISEKTSLNKKVPLSDFKYKSNHYYIMTDGGLPIYSRYGDEIDASCILSSFSAIIPKYNRTNLKELQELE